MTKTITGEIADLAIKRDKNGKEYIEVKLQQESQRYATKCNAFGEALVARFKDARKGMTIGLVIEEEDGSYVDDDGQTRKVTYRNVVDIVGVEQKANNGRSAPQGSVSDSYPDTDYWAAKNASIEMQWAIGQAGANARELGSYNDMDALLHTIEDLAPRLLAMKNRLVAQDTSQDDQHTASEPTPVVGAPENPTDAPRDKGELLTRCRENWNMTAPQVRLLLGVETNDKIGDLAEAWDTIVKAKTGGEA